MMNHIVFLFVLLFCFCYYCIGEDIVSSSSSSLLITEADQAAQDINKINALFDSINKLGKLANNDTLLSYENIEVKRSPYGGFGVFAKTDIPHGSPFITLPRTTFLLHSLIWQHPSFPSIIRPLIDSGLLFNSSAFALWLWEESHNTASPWSAYINFLPQSYSNAYFIDDNDFHILEQLLPSSTSTGNNIRTILHEPKSMVINQYNIIKEKIYQGKDDKPEGFLARPPTFDEFRRYLAAVVSRAWALDNQYVLIPLLDLVNHDPTMLPPVFNADYVSTYANKNYTKGEELFHSYGQKSDWDLLVMYGFIPDSNIYNAYNFKVSANPLFPQLITEHGLSMEQNILHDGSIPFSAINLFRLIHLNNDEQLLHNNIKSGGMISWRNERESLKALLLLLKGFLSEMPTTIEQDRFNLQRVINGELKISYFSVSLLRHFLKTKLLLTSAINTIGNYWLALLQA